MAGDNNSMRLPAPEDTGHGGYGSNGYGNWGNAAMGSGLGGMLGGMFGNMSYKSPYAQAQPYLEKIPGTVRESLDPYMKAGQSQIAPLQNQFSTLMNDPSGFMDKLGANYKQSPGYQFRVNQGVEAANRAAGSQGMLGSPAEQASLAQYSSNLANQDYQQYLQNAFGAYGAGLQGSQGLEQQGFGASEDYAKSMGDYYAMQAQMARAQQESENQRNAQSGSGWGSILGGLAGFLL